jgi:hypothetical protein
MMGWMAPVRHLGAGMVVAETHHRGEPSMNEIKTIGLDLAKHVFQAHGVDAGELPVIQSAKVSGPAVLPDCSNRPDT